MRIRTPTSISGSSGALSTSRFMTVPRHRTITTGRPLGGMNSVGYGARGIRVSHHNEQT